MCDFILSYVVRGVLPKTILDDLDDPEKISFATAYVKKSISMSPTYVRLPEKILRLALFFSFFLFHILEIASLKTVSRISCVRLASKIHPIIDDGVRLYLFLAMFALFEEDSFRKKRGFHPYSEILNSYTDTKV